MAELYIKYEYWIAVMQLSLAMLGMGATLNRKDFLDVFVEPRAISAGIAVQIVAVPLTAFLFLRLLGVQDGLAVGIAMIAAIPGGTNSNIFTFLARGNAAMSISITAVTTAVCLISTPLILSLMISEYLPADFTMPRGQIMKEIGVNLLLPLIIGMAYLAYLPRSAPALSKWSIRGSIIGVMMIVVGSIITGRLNMSAFGYNNVLILLLFATVLAIPGVLIPKLLRLSWPDRTAITWEVNVRNINLGVMVNVSIFPAAIAETAQLGNTVLFTLLLFGFFQLIAATGLIPLYRWMGRDRELVPVR